jgi:hypothetical protein
MMQKTFAAMSSRDSLRRCFSLPSQPCVRRAASVGAGLLVAFTLAGAQLWSNPDLVTKGRYAVAAPGFACAPGDTFWLVLMRDEGAWHQVECYWNAGDFWQGPLAISPPDSLPEFEPPRASQDPQGNVRVVWSSGWRQLWPPEVWGTILATIRDSVGWHSPDTAHVTSGYWPHGMDFAYDHAGVVYMPYQSDGGFGTTASSVACYLKWIDGQWLGAYGLAGGLQDFALLPEAAPAPDSGLWAVLYHTRYSLSAVEVYRIADSSSSLRFTFPAPSNSPHAIATDSSGRVWVLYGSGGSIRWVRIEDDALADSGVVTMQADTSAPSMTVDHAGAVWAAWRRGRALMASYDSGLRWTEPEVVSESASALVGIVSDSVGLMHVAFSTVHDDSTYLYVTHRLEPAALQAGKTHEPASPTVAVLSGNPAANAQTIRFSLPVRTQVDAHISDITGRTTASLASGTVGPGSYEVVWDVRAVPSGIYFLQFSAPGHRETRRLVVVR